MLRTAIVLMKCFLNNSPRQRHWYAFLNWKEEGEGLDYLRSSLRYRVNDPKVLSQVESIFAELQRDGNANAQYGAEVRKHISIGFFQGKRDLMDDFLRKITEFAPATA